MEHKESTRQTEMDTKDKPNKFKLWFKRVGIAGFMFFLIKGLAWLFFGKIILDFFSCKS